MAKVKAAPRSFESRLIESLRSGLRAVGIAAEVKVDPIKGTRLHRVHVTSPAFDKLRPSERQDLVWRIIGFTFPQDEQLRISMILTLSPRELSGR